MRLLCRRIDPAYCIAIVFIALKVCLMLDVGISKSSSSCFIDGMCAVVDALRLEQIECLD
jgi:hypothetical protein